MRPEVKQILDSAKLAAKESYGVYSSYATQLRMLGLPYDEYETAVQKLAKILRV